MLNLEQSIILYDKDRSKHQNHFRYEELRNEFVRKFSPKELAFLEIDDYVVGKVVDGETNRDTFCYWVERKTDELGRITGSPAIKFGIYVDRETQEYIYLKKYRNPDEAFFVKREEIIKLLNIAESKNYWELDKIDLTPTFKGKILFLYYPNLYLNLFSERYIDFFLKSFEQYDAHSSDVLLRKMSILKEIKDVHPIMSSWSVYKFREFLYYYWGNPVEYLPNK